MLFTVNLTRSGRFKWSSSPGSWQIVKVDSSKETKEVKLDEGKTTDEGHPVLGRNHPEVDRLSWNPEARTEDESWQNFRPPLLEHLLASFALHESHSWNKFEVVNNLCY